MLKPFLASLFICLCSLSAIGHAAEGFYLGVRAASVTVDESEIDDLKDNQDLIDIKNAGKGSLLVGYDFGKNVAVELELGASDHEVEYNIPGVPDQDLEISTFGLYMAYRSEGQLYFKGGAGLLSRTLKLTPTFVGQDEEDNGALISITLGGGYRLNESVSLEGGWVTIEDGIGSFGFNALYHFQ